jgi:hypothetical protein
MADAKQTPDAQPLTRGEVRVLASLRQTSTIRSVVQLEGGKAIIANRLKHRGLVSSVYRDRGKDIGHRITELGFERLREHLEGMARKLLAKRRKANRITGNGVQVLEGGGEVDEDLVAALKEVHDKLAKPVRTIAGISLGEWEMSSGGQNVGVQVLFSEAVVDGRPEGH